MKLHICLLSSCLRVEKRIIGNTIMKIKSYCLKLCCRVRLSVLFVHAERGAVSINTKVKSVDTESTDSRNHPHGGRGAGVRPPELH